MWMIHGAKAPPEEAVERPPPGWGTGEGPADAVRDNQSALSAATAGEVAAASAAAPKTNLQASGSASPSHLIRFPCKERKAVTLYHLPLQG